MQLWNKYKQPGGRDLLQETSGATEISEKSEAAKCKTAGGCGEFVFHLKAFRLKFSRKKKKNSPLYQKVLCVFYFACKLCLNSSMSQHQGSFSQRHLGQCPWAEGLSFLCLVTLGSHRDLIRGFWGPEESSCRQWMPSGQRKKSTPWVT